MLFLLSLSEGLNLTPRMNVRSGEQVLLSSSASRRRGARPPPGARAAPLCPAVIIRSQSPPRPIFQALALGLVAATPLLGVPMPAAAEDGMFGAAAPVRVDALEPHGTPRR